MKLADLPARARSIPPRAVDLTLVGLFTAGTLAEGIFVQDTGHPVISTSFALAIVLTLLWRRSHPEGVAVLIPIALTGGELLGGFLLEDSTTPFLSIFASAYALGRYGDKRRAPWAFGWIIGFLVLTIALQGSRPEQAVTGVILLSAPLFAGRVLRRRHELGDALRARTAELEAEGAGRAERAVEAERARIAGELQSVVANGVSAMVVQAEGVPRVLDAGDREQAGHALLLIEETGRDALAEMRRLLGVLRREGDEALLAPQPSLDRAVALVEAMRDYGLEVQYAVDGEPVSLAPGLELAAYRVLQLALGSAAASAGRASVRLDYGERELGLVVEDDRDPAAVPAASDVLAMRERVDLYGGTLFAGAGTVGGYAVRVKLPREEASA